MTFFDLLPERRLLLRLHRDLSIRVAADRATFELQRRAPSTTDVGIPLVRYRTAFEPANRLLAEGAPLGDLRDAAIAGGGAAGGAAYVLFLQRLTMRGIIEFPVVDDEGARAVIRPQWGSFVPALSPEDPPSGDALERFALVRRDGASWLVESPLVGAHFLVDDLAALDAPVVRRALHAAGFLERSQNRSDRRETTLKQWEFHDLVFSMRHRRGWHRAAYGGLFPFLGDIAPLPAAREPWPGRRIPLERAPPPNDAGGESFVSVHERRRSERSYDEAHPLTLAQLGVFLDRAARVRAFETVPVTNFSGRTAPFEISRRPYPNGGASYELEIYPVVQRCEGLAAGMYHYDAARHELVEVSADTDAVERYIHAAKVATAGVADPHLVLGIAARFARVLWKYRSIAYSVILRNTGALYQTMYLVATELGLSPCGIGSGDSALFARVTGLDPVVEGTVGDFLLGGRPRSKRPS